MLLASLKGNKSICHRLKLQQSEEASFHPVVEMQVKTKPHHGDNLHGHKSRERLDNWLKWTQPIRSDRKWQLYEAVLLQADLEIELNPFCPAVSEMNQHHHEPIIYGVDQFVPEKQEYNKLMDTNIKVHERTI